MALGTLDAVRSAFGNLHSAEQPATDPDVEVEAEPKAKAKTKKKAKVDPDVVAEE